MTFKLRVRLYSSILEILPALDELIGFLNFLFVSFLEIVFFGAFMSGPYFSTISTPTL
ncbi:hypothetical protein [Rossellomorea sp. LJF3]|uniref:hypothetical protein n=1 Tax=Rossellomorea sp. LJF3 TaxID=3126099 RepID=UPI00300CE42D